MQTLFQPRRWASQIVQRRGQGRKPLDQTPQLQGQRFLFIGGLHRSGTSILHRLIREHPEVSGFSDTGVPEDEGQHLQTVYPPAKFFGGPGRFAFDNRAHLTEMSPLISTGNRDRLLREWGAYLDFTKRLFVEKSPPNLIRSRFLQRLFPDAKFLFIVRHPVVVSLSEQKHSKASIRELMNHWTIAHRYMIADVHKLNSFAIIRYEDFVEHPVEQVEKIWKSCDLPSYAPRVTVSDHNEQYLLRWRSRDDQIGTALEQAADQELLELFGYRLSEPYVVEPTLSCRLGPH